MHVSGNNAKSKIDPKLWTVKSKKGQVIPNTSEKTSNSLRLPTYVRKIINPIKAVIGGPVGFALGYPMKIGLGMKYGGDAVYARKDKETFLEHVGRELKERPDKIMIKPFVALFSTLVCGVISAFPVNIGHTDSLAYKGLKFGAKPLETTNKEEKLNQNKDKINKNIEKFFEQKDNESYTQQFDRILRVDNIIKTKGGKKIEFTPFDRKKQNNYYDHVYGSEPRWNGEKIIGIMDATTKNEARKMLDDGPAIFNLTGTVDEVLQKKLYDIVDPNNGKTDEEAMEDLKDAINTYHGEMINEMKNMVYGEENNKEMTDFWKETEISNENGELIKREVLQGTATIDFNEVEKDLNVQRDKTNPAFVKLVRLNVIKELRAEFNEQRKGFFNDCEDNTSLRRAYINQEAEWGKNWYDKWNEALDSGKKNANDEIMDSLKCDKNSYSEIMDSLKCDKNSARNENNYKYFRCKLSMLTRLIEEEDKLIKQDDQVGINEKIFSDIAKEYRVKEQRNKKDGLTTEEDIEDEIGRLKRAITNDKNITETENNNSREKIRGLLVEKREIQ